MFEFVFLIIVSLVSVIAVAAVVVYKIKSLRVRRQQRTVATPYGMMMGPTDAELRRTRALHLPPVVVSGRKGLGCGENNFDTEAQQEFAICRQCGRWHRLF